MEMYSNKSTSNSSDTNYTKNLLICFGQVLAEARVPAECSRYSLQIIYLLVFFIFFTSTTIGLIFYAIYRNTCYPARARRKETALPANSISDTEEMVTSGGRARGKGPDDVTEDQRESYSSNATRVTSLVSSHSD